MELLCSLIIDILRQQMHVVLCNSLQAVMAMQLVIPSRSHLLCISPYVRPLDEIRCCPSIDSAMRLSRPLYDGKRFLDKVD